MVPADSRRIPRAPRYSGCHWASDGFGYGAVTLCDVTFQSLLLTICLAVSWSYNPHEAGTSWVWALPRSLAATYGIDVSFSSSGYLDVSVPRVPPACLWIQHAVAEVCSAGFPHSEISGSMDMCSSPKLIAACHVFHRLLVPRHPPCALLCLTSPGPHGSLSAMGLIVPADPCGCLLPTLA